MSTWSIDTILARALVHGWIDHGDDLAGLQRTVELELATLQLGSSQSTVVQRLAAASTRLWVSATFANLVLGRVEAADGAAFTTTPDLRTIEAFLRQAGDRVRASQENACLPSWVAPVYSSALGDLGGTFGKELRSPFYVTGSTPDARGRSLVVRALVDTVGELQIRTDEFELIELDNGSYLVVLAGVVDLTHPHLGLDDRNRTPRDLDMYAVPSSRSASTADNRYAQLVRDGLVVAGVPRGAQLMIVGHSFGADTALDLAADSEFTSRYRVTHVVAAAYHSQPQLGHVDPAVNVLVLQNRRDVPVIAESIVSGHPPGLAILAALSPRVEWVGERQLVDVFEGGGAGAGHAQSNYIEQVKTTDDESLVDFFASIDAAGFARSGTSWAIDVSVPAGAERGDSGRLHGATPEPLEARPA